MLLSVSYETRLAECGSKHLALYQALRDAIADGLLPQGDRLPSTRGLALHFGLSRGSVSLAYEMLAAEGYVRAGVGQGTFVAGVPGIERDGRSGEVSLTHAKPMLTRWGNRLAELSGPMAACRETEEESAAAKRAVEIDFSPRNIGERWFPRAEWRSVVSSEWKRRSGDSSSDFHPAEGSEELRRQISGRLRRERGIRCRPEDVVMTGGSMQAIALLCQLLLEEGRTAVVENPGFGGIRRAIRTTGARLAPEEVDAEGIVPGDWDADVLFVTPTRQFPTGAVLTYERRLALLEWASRRRAWIVEDDYDSDFRWGGRPIEPLKALDREQRVIYVGTFSRSMKTEVRIGYAVVPPALREPLIAAKQLYEPYPTALTEQRALAEWMAQGGYDRHIRRMRRIYGKLHALLHAAMEERLGGLFRLVPSDAGLHLYAKWNRNAVQYDQLRRECRELGVGWRDASAYDAGSDAEADGDAGAGSGIRGEPRAAIFGFAHLDEEQIRRGVDSIRRGAERLGLV